MFGVVFLGVVTAIGGGMFRDVLIGNIPPMMFRDPRYVTIAAIVALLTFAVAYFSKENTERHMTLFNSLLNLMDALGLGAFTIGGMNAAMNLGYQENAFLVVFVGVLTGIGGGMLRDVLAGEVPFVLYKQIYALACILGGILYYVLLRAGVVQAGAMACSVCSILLIRLLAAWKHWDLPRIS